MEARSGSGGEVGWGSGEPPESPREENGRAMYVIGLVPQGQHPDPPFSVAAAARIKVQTNMNLAYLWIHQKRVTFP